MGVSGPRAGNDSERSANLLGALSLAIVDRASDAVADAGPADTAAAALSAMYHFLERPSVDMLRQVLGLSHSGTVRLVDRLEASGYITREAGGDGRSTLVTLTRSGTAAAERITQARISSLEVALGVLSAEERGRLDDLISRLLVGMMRGPGAVKWTCRMCYIAACRRKPGCPLHNAAREKYSF